MSNQLDLPQFPVCHEAIESDEGPFDGFLFTAHAESFQGEATVLPGDTQSLQVGMTVRTLRPTVEQSGNRDQVTASFDSDKRGQGCR